MNIEIHGSGRAAGALVLASARAGHRIVGIRARNAAAAAEIEELVEMSEGTPELRVIAVSDAAIREVADQIAGEDPIPTVHVSGAVPLAALDPVRDVGADVGSFHPLQTLPSAEIGAMRLEGAWIAITADGRLRKALEDWARSLGGVPFLLDDDKKPLYHAAAAASANFPLASLGVAEELFGQAGVPFEAARPLIEAIVANAFEMGPRPALTGPIARGDAGTVAAQLEAVDAHVPAAAAIFRDLSRATALYAGATPEVLDVIG